MRWIVGGEAALGAAASPSQMGRFETPPVPVGLREEATGAATAIVMRFRAASSAKISPREMDRTNS